jgi:hypothetical protein
MATNANMHLVAGANPVATAKMDHSMLAYDIIAMINGTDELLATLIPHEGSVNFQQVQRRRCQRRHLYFLPMLAIKFKVQHYPPHHLSSMVLYIYMHIYVYVDLLKQKPMVVEN